MSHDDTPTSNSPPSSAGDMEPDEPSVGSDKPRRHKLLALFGIAAVAMLLAWQFGEYLKLDYLATQETNPARNSNAASCARVWSRFSDLRSRHRLVSPRSSTTNTSVWVVLRIRSDLIAGQFCINIRSHDFVPHRQCLLRESIEQEIW